MVEPKERNDERLNFWVSKSLKDRVKAAAKKAGFASASDLIRGALLEVVEEIEGRL